MSACRWWYWQTSLELWSLPGTFLSSWHLLIYSDLIKSLCGRYRLIPTLLLRELMREQVKGATAAELAFRPKQCLYLFVTPDKESRLWWFCSARQTASLGSHQAAGTVLSRVSPSFLLSRQPQSFHPSTEAFPTPTFQVKTKLRIDWFFLDAVREIEIASRALFPFPTQASICFKMEIIIFIMEEQCQEWKAWKHEKCGYTAKGHFLNTSFWLKQLFLLWGLTTWGITYPFKATTEYQEGLCT